MHNYVDQLFNRPFESFFSNAASDPLNSWMSVGASGGYELRDEGDYYVVEMDLPGVAKDQIQIDGQHRTLKVTAERHEAVTESKGQTLHSYARQTGKISRIITIPGAVKAAEAEANYKDGVLTVRLPKVTDEPNTTRIEVS
jgi:HSP20 family protein